MKRILFLIIAAFCLSSCADEKTKPVGPVSNLSNMPWNTAVAGQGGGQFSMLEQNRYRR